MTVLQLRRVLLCASLWIVFCNAQDVTLRLSPPSNTVAIPDSIIRGNNDWPFRYWDGDYLIAYRLHSAVRIYNRTGAFVREVNVWFDGAQTVTVLDAAITRQGELFVTGSSVSTNGQVAQFIAAVGTDGKVAHVIRTTPYVAHFICSTGDGTVWTFGAERVAGDPAPYDHALLRHYSFKSGLIEGFFKKSELSTKTYFPISGWYPGQTNMRCTPTLVVVYNGPTDQLIKYDIASKRLDVATVQPFSERVVWTGFALTQTGDLFASYNDKSQTSASSGLSVLQLASRGAARWVAVPGTTHARGQSSSGFSQLLGSDGTNIVYTDALDPNRLLFSGVVR